jgi:L-asparaginase
MLRLALSLSFSAVFALPATGQPLTQLPKVRIVATGGTIAYVPEQTDAPGAYRMIPIGDVASSIPDLRRYAQVETEQFANLFSTSLTADHWLRLARRINELFKAGPDLAGIVVTHGTATLEETAYFLHLTVKSDRPVVVVGAQRGPGAISPDGPLNLLSAVRVAASPEAVGQGVLVVMDERILSARDVKKLYARFGGFDTGEMGMLGVVAPHGVEFYYAPARKHTITSDLDVSNLSSLPKVSISYSYVGAVGLADPEASGIVVATNGFTPAEEEYYRELRRQGIVVATTFRSGEQVSSPVGPSEDVPTVVVAKHLSPTKARILLMLALTRTKSSSEIQRIFDSH